MWIFCQSEELQFIGGTRLWWRFGWGYIAEWGNDKNQVTCEYYLCGLELIIIKIRFKVDPKWNVSLFITYFLEGWKQKQFQPSTFSWYFHYSMFFAVYPFSNILDYP